MSAIDYAEDELEVMAMTARARALGRSVHAPEPETVDMTVILHRVAKEYRVTPEAILGRSRLAHIARARLAVYRELRTKGGWSFPEIGHFMNRDHTTVMAGLLSRDERRARRCRLVAS